ncbi:TadE/TadG family type IV pilus assembly protein [Paenibacillus piri]|uniref:Pilus assembly protein n=1 Tax=Paenibacillus piri TaxID=2547395 RepID=A0A4R5KX68_9BACL|nr:pilus assembly protein [Paenibacillus piri]TDF99590.1 pilus assembly protein [Paenibacillus piri]
MKLIRDQEGGIVMEAALVLPMFLSFVLMLIVFIQISLTEMALQSAVSETTKVLAVHMYPVDLLYAQAKSKWDQSAANGWIEQAKGKIEAVQQKAVNAEQFVEDYERWIPDPVVKLIGWEQKEREQLEALAQAETEEAKERVKAAYTPVLNSAFAPIVAMHANPSRIKKERLKVTRVTFPDLNHKEHAFMSIEAEYELPLHVPFFKKTVFIRKQAFERAWVGGSG